MQIINCCYYEIYCQICSTQWHRLCWWLYWFPSQGATMLFLAGTFRLSSVASDFRFSAEIGNERGTSRLLFRLGSPAFIDLVRPGSSERLLVCPGENPLKNRMLSYVDIHTKRTLVQNMYYIQVFNKSKEFIEIAIF